MDGKKLFANMPRTKVNIVIDLNSDYFTQNNIKIVGLDYNAFENVELDTLTIRGSTDKFYLMDKSLIGTQLKTFKHSKDIIFVGLENATNSEFVEVVI